MLSLFAVSISSLYVLSLIHSHQVLVLTTSQKLCVSILTILPGGWFKNWPSTPLLVSLNCFPPTPSHPSPAIRACIWPPRLLRAFPALHPA